MKALFIVDLQNDFLPNGALPTPKGNIIIPVLNKIMDKFDFVLASKDWHPENTIHFEKWPVHCVQGTYGAEIPKELNSEKIHKIFLKGTGNKDDGYSAFEATNENLTEFLKSNNIDELFVTGLTAEYCVKQTVLDALKNGFKTYVIRDGIEGIYQHEGDVENAFTEMEKAGAVILTSDKIF
ncbi:MAG: isochorismatase family protein [Melioribacter sp.]|uniref:isochorismatase family protein n=1 Tax=Rosettibacter primus TaxID=3111523 RepID=UPI00247CFC39|nr:isochorismatase family protein [Melioribacter sp.]